MSLSKEDLEYRLTTASAVTNPELLLAYQRQALNPAADSSDRDATRTDGE
jgi:hypothetical protein